MSAVMRDPRFLIGAGVLGAAWLGPLPRMVGESFTAHMLLHMIVVAIAAPLLAAALAARLDGRAIAGRMLAFALLASLLDLFVIWGWHLPALHEATRTTGWVLAAEQGSFLAVGLFVWVTALAAPAASAQAAALAGAGALFFTSMHMTLLGVLLGLAQTPICRTWSGAGPLFGLTILEDQQVGGTVMLAVGGSVYLAGGLVLVARVLRLPAGDLEERHP